MTTRGDVQVTDNPARHRFEARVSGDPEDVAVAEYTRRGDVLHFIHTEVPEPFRGRGIGETLAREALDQTRANGLGVVPECRFIRAFIRKHPEYQDLVRPG